MGDKSDSTLGDESNEILISRGASKEKYSIKAPKVEIIWWPRKFPSLSPKEIDIISLLVGPEGSFTKLKKYSGLKTEDDVKLLWKDETYNRLWEEHLENIAEAIRAGLIWYPLVSEFIYTHKALGHKEELRAIKRGWETGIKRPGKYKDIRFILNLDKIVEARNSGKTWKEIRRNLMKRKIIRKMTWQGLEKKVKKAWEAKWAKVNKKAPPIL
jgi:hypothetical protein